VESVGPTFKSMAVEDGAAVVSFDHVGGGLVAPGDKPHGFAVARASAAWWGLSLVGWVCGGMPRLT
jgi:hypothetical protein